MNLTERQLAISVLTPCTLNCRLCTALTPLYNMRGNHYIGALDSLKSEITALFQVYDYIQDLTITGGEPLLHKELPEITAFLLENFSEQFETLRIFSNGTVVPDVRLLESIQKSARNNFEFVIDRYDLSDKADDIKRLLEQYHIGYHENIYCGGAQHCGGWVDCGPIDKFRNYAPEKVQEIVSRCHYATWKCLLLFKGKVHLCSLAACGEDMGFFQLKPGEYVDLLDPRLSLEQKKEIASALGHRAVTACQYCNGFDVERSERYPAAEQA